LGVLIDLARGALWRLRCIWRMFTQFYAAL